MKKTPYDTSPFHSALRPYYVVGLLGYMFKALEKGGLPVSATTMTGLSVPFVVLLIWWVVRRIRRHHGDNAETVA